jgi:hypothetical protein
VGSPLDDRTGSGRDGFAAGSRQQPVEDGRPQARTEPDHFVRRMRLGKEGRDGRNGRDR